MDSDYISNLDYRPQNIANQICELLKKAIMNNDLKGGEKIVESRLQNKLGFSRSPIREALRELEKLGLVEIQPRKGTFVKKITRKDIKENYLVRAPLEGLAAQEAVDNMDASDHQKLNNALDEMRKAAESYDIKNYWLHHNEFHSGFINVCGNGLLVNLLKVLRTHSVRHRMSFPHYEEDLSASVTVHEQILAMFKNKHVNKDDLQQFVTKHILDVLPIFLQNVPE